MRRLWKPHYLLSLALAGTLGLIPAAFGQNAAPADADANVEVNETNNNDSAPAVEAELDGEAPGGPAAQTNPPARPDTPRPPDPPTQPAGGTPPAGARIDAEPATERAIDLRGNADRNPSRPGDRADRRGDRDARGGIDIDARFSSDLGFRYEAIPQRGFRVTNIDNDSLWARSGFRQGDHIYRVGDQRIGSWNEFRNVMGQYYGQRVPIYVIREEREVPIYVDLTSYERPAYLDPDYDLNTAQRAGFGIGLNKVDNAVVVSRVYPHSPAELAGMRVGDIIVSANGREIQEVDEVVGYVRSLTPGDDLVLHIRRAGENMRISSRLATWAEALTAAPPEEVLQPHEPQQHYADHDARINALEERIRDLEAAVRGLRKDATRFETSTDLRRTEPQERDVLIDDDNAIVPAAPTP